MRWQQHGSSDDSDSSGDSDADLSSDEAFHTEDIAASPVNGYMNDSRRHVFRKDEWPTVVRGQMLVVNSLDTNCHHPTFVEIAEEEEADGVSEENSDTSDNDDAGGSDVAVQNVNVFHRKYLQYRQNPLYASDPDLSKLCDLPASKTSSAKPPAFTLIFGQATAGGSDSGLATANGAIDSHHSLGNGSHDTNGYHTSRDQLDGSTASSLLDKHVNGNGQSYANHTSHDHKQSNGNHTGHVSNELLNNGNTNNNWLGASGGRISGGHGHQVSLESGYHSSTPHDQDGDEDETLGGLYEDDKLMTQEAGRRKKKLSAEQRKHRRRRESRRNNDLISAADVESMLLGAPANSINRKIDVRKENEDVAVESLLDNIIDGPDGPQSLFNVDVMSEAMDVAFVDGRVRVVSTVRCDRTTKIPGYDYVRHRSSVIVTKTTDIDMMHSNDGRRLYERLQHASLLATQQFPHHAAADDLDNDRNGLGDLEIDPRDEEKFIDAESLNIYRALRQLADVYNKNVLDKQMASHTKGGNTSRHRVVNSDDEYDTDVIEKQLDDCMTRSSRCVLPQSQSDVSSYVDTATNQLDILY